VELKNQGLVFHWRTNVRVPEPSPTHGQTRHIVHDWRTPLSGVSAVCCLYPCDAFRAFLTAILLCGNINISPEKSGHTEAQSGVFLRWTNVHLLWTIWFFGIIVQYAQFTFAFSLFFCVLFYIAFGIMV
jgi:hypothetical protein